MIGNEKFCGNQQKKINKTETLNMLRRDIAASSLKVLCENFNPVKSYEQVLLFVYEVYGKNISRA